MPKNPAVLKDRIRYKAKLIDIAKIEADSVQPRAHLNSSVAEEYAADIKNGSEFEPVVIFADADGKHWLADGFHRLAGHRQAGLKKILAIVRIGTRRDALLHSAGANARHGLRRTAADKERAVKLLLADPEWSSWSDREIARRCVVSHTFVAEIRRSLTGNVASENSENPNKTRTFTTRHGTTAEMNVGNIGKGEPAEEPSASPDEPTTDEPVEDADQGEGEGEGEGDQGDGALVPSADPADTIVDDEAPAPPWAEFEGQVREVISTLRGASRRLGEVLGYDAETKQLRNQWARKMSSTGTIGGINQVIRFLENAMPAEPDAKSAHGFRTHEEVRRAEALAAGR